ESYFAAAAALCGGTVTLRGLSANSVQGDIALLTVLQQMGARVKWNQDSVEVTGAGQLRGVDVAMNGMPDMVATLAAIDRVGVAAPRRRRERSGGRIGDSSVAATWREHRDVR